MQAEIPVLSFIFAVLVLFPLPWYFRARNIAAMSIGIWLFVVNVVYAIDALQWTGTYRIPSLLWCDISEFSGIVRVPPNSKFRSFCTNNSRTCIHTCSMPLYLHSPGTDGVFLPNGY
jgi:hypothetical protein